MTNSELIALLQTMPGDATVSIEGATGSHRLTAQDMQRTSATAIGIHTVVDVQHVARPRHRGA